MPAQPRPAVLVPRECPRGTFWATPVTTGRDAELLGGSTRVHIVERGWVEPMRTARVYTYRLPEASFAEDLDVRGYWLGRETVVPDQTVELGDLVERHATAGIELRVVDNLWPIWSRVVASLLEFSGIRLRDALPAETAGRCSPIPRPPSCGLSDGAALRTSPPGGSRREARR